MSDILAATRTHLLADTNTAALIGTRVYFDALPQSAALPALVLELAETEIADRHLTATGTNHRADVRIYCYATTRATAVALAEAVHAAVEFATGTWSGVAIKRAFVYHAHDISEPPRDGSAEWRFLRAMMTVVWHA